MFSSIILKTVEYIVINPSKARTRTCASIKAKTLCEEICSIMLNKNVRRELLMFECVGDEGRRRKGRRSGMWLLGCCLWGLSMVKVFLLRIEGEKNV